MDDDEALLQALEASKALAEQEDRELQRVLKESELAHDRDAAQRAQEDWELADAIELSKRQERQFEDLDKLPDADLFGRLVQPAAPAPAQAPQEDAQEIVPCPSSKAGCAAAARGETTEGRSDFPLQPRHWQTAKQRGCGSMARLFAACWLTAGISRRWRRSTASPSRTQHAQRRRARSSW